MLRNIETLIISYDDCWHHLSSRVLGSLMDLMGRPSLVAVQVGDHIPGLVINLALSSSVKHLTLPLERHAIDGLLERPRPTTDPVYLEYLYIGRPFLFLALLSVPISRLSISRLRKLFVRSPALEEHASIWQLLQFCLNTLEDFEFNPNHDGMLSIMINETEVMY